MTDETLDNPRVAARWLRGACSSGDPLHHALHTVLDAYARVEHETEALLTALREESNRLHAERAELLADLERRYIQFVRAARNSPSGSDYWRWNGHAEAYRDVCESIRAAAGLPAVSMGSTEWRAANGLEPR